MTGRVIKDGLCGICPAGCWVRTTLEHGKVQQVDPLPNHPLGTICRIGKHSPDIIYDPDRLKYPLKRKGPKGSYDFERISWHEAFNLLVAKLKEHKELYGPESTAIYTGRGSFDMALCDLFQPSGVAVSSASSVLFPFGSPNTLGVGALCYVSFAMIAPHVTMGEMYITMDTDIENAELIVVWGANPATDSPPFSHTQILKACERGAEVVVIDPRFSETARETGAQWIPIRPGTDGALALGLIFILIEQELFDEDFVRQWTIGFSELSQLVQHYRPEIVEDITGVPAATVRSLAYRIADAQGACPVMYTGLEYSDSGVQAIRAVFTLWTLAGQLDVPGGLLIRMKENIFPQNRNDLQPNPAPEKALGRDRFPVYSAYRGESHAIALPNSVLQGDPYTIRSLIVLGGSLLTSWPDPALWKKTLEALEFLVTIDRYHTADSAYADLVLPATTMYEITSYMRYGPVFKIREKIIEPQFEARNDFLILAELAKRLGYGHLYPQSEEEILAKALESTGYSPEEVRAKGGSVQIDPVMMQYKKWEKGLLRDDGKQGFATPSRKFEIASSVLAEHGYDPLPVYTEPREGPREAPELAAEYPLVFNSGARTYYDFRSQHHGVKSLCQHQKDPAVTLNVQDAADRGIMGGEWVWLKTARGKLRFRANVTKNIVQGAVDANMGGGGPLGPLSWQQCNVNELTSIEQHDPISGFPIYKTLLCQVEKIKGQRVQSHSESPDKAIIKPVIRGKQTKATIRRVYLDNNATTPLDPQVLTAMLPFLQEEFGNPSSIHSLGNRAKKAVENSRRTVASLLHCSAGRIVFTSGGSESNNLAILGAVKRFAHQKAHVICSLIEHPAVLHPFKKLEEQGIRVDYLESDHNGLISPEDLEKTMAKDTVLVSIMLANNESGAIQPIKELAHIARQRGALFHTDAVQAAGKINIDVNSLGVDLLSISGHKMTGPKGVGALYLKRGITLTPLIQGGGQESGIRSGTENVAAIVGLGEASKLAAKHMQSDAYRNISLLRDRLERELKKLVPGAKRNGSAKNCLPNTLNMTLPSIRGETLVYALDRRGISCSAGSACKSGNPAPSHVLKAMGLSDEAAHCSIRFSLGSYTSKDDISYLVEVLADLLENKSGIIRFVPCR